MIWARVLYIVKVVLTFRRMYAGLFAMDGKGG